MTRFWGALVTGAAGVIGYHTARKLLERGDEVVGLDNLNDYYDVSLKEARLARLDGREGFRFVFRTNAAFDLALQRAQRLQRDFAVRFDAEDAAALARALKEREQLLRECG